MPPWPTTWSAEAKAPRTPVPTAARRPRRTGCPRTRRGPRRPAHTTGRATAGGRTGLCRPTRCRQTLQLLPLPAVGRPPDALPSDEMPLNCSCFINLDRAAAGWQPLNGDEQPTGIAAGTGAHTLLELTHVIIFVRDDEPAHFNCSQHGISTQR